MPSFDDYFMPRIPTQYERPGAEALPRRKLGVSVDTPPAPPIRPSLAGLYEAEPSIDELLAGAYGTLADTQPRAQSLAAIGGYAEGQAGARRAEDAALQARNQEYRDAAQSVALPAAFLGGPVGVGANALLTGLSGVDTLDAFSEGEMGSAGLNAAGAMLGARGLGKTFATPKPSLGRAIGPFSPLAGPSTPMQRSSDPMERVVTSILGDTPPPSSSRLTAQAFSGTDRQTQQRLREGGKLSARDVKALKKQGKLPSSSAEEEAAAIDEAMKRDILFGGVGGYDEAGEFIRPSARTPIGR